MDDEILRTRLRERIAATGVTARKLSLAAGSPDIVRTILSGRSKSPRSQTLQALARELGCDVRYLMGEIDDPGPAQATPEGAALIMHQMPNGKVRLQINKVVDMAKALRILAELEGGE